MSARPAEANPVRLGTALLYSLMEQAAQYPDAIRLGRGDPDFPTPNHIQEAVRDALDRDEPPAPPEGLSELRQAIAQRLRRVNGVEVDPDTEVVVTQGGQQALFLMVQAALAPGDEVLVPDPSYNTYKDAIAFAGARLVPVGTRVEEDFHVDPERVRAAVGERTRAIVLISPNNPTAAVLAPQYVEELVALAEAHDLLLLADDTYDQFLYDGAVHTSPASLREVKRRTLTLNTLSKTYAMTGWRVGWVVGPAALMARLLRLKEAVSGGISVVAQRAGIAALTGPQDPVAAMHQACARRRRIVLDALARMGLRYGNPAGGQFVFVDTRRLELTSLDLARRILEEAHVLVYPGVGFGEAWDCFLRITFLQPGDVLSEGLRRMEEVIRRLG